MSDRVTIGDAELWCGDCRDVMRAMVADSIDAIVTDPPYGLSFMGKDWDHGIPGEHFWAEALRVAKPGAHLLAFGGTRTFHRLACAIEDAGWEIRDCVMWVYGSGFPKSLDVSKAIDKVSPRVDMFADFAKHYAERRAVVGLTHAAICDAGGFFAEHNHGGASVNWEKGHNVPTREQWKVLQPLLKLDVSWLPLIDRVEAEREKLGERTSGDPVAWYGQTERGHGVVSITAPATDAARQWQGWGTALKPAWEPIIVARKPLIGTVADNVLKHGTGALNIDRSRIGMMTPEEIARSGASTTGMFGLKSINWKTEEREPLGRWPANLIHDGSDEVVALFPETTSGTFSGHRNLPKTKNAFGHFDLANECGVEGSTGSAARFFKECKFTEDDESNVPSASDVGNQSDSCATFIVPDPAETRNSDSRNVESQVTPASTGNCSDSIQTHNRALIAEQPENIDITATTASLSKLSGSAHHATAENINQESLGINGLSGGRRFLYCAKASKDDRDGLLEGAERDANKWNAGGIGERRRQAGQGQRANHHPTVKPTELMRYLCRLVTPPGGIVFDPFAGSGSTGVAALADGFRFIGCEIDLEYFDIVCERLSNAQRQVRMFA